MNDCTIKTAQVRTYVGSYSENHQGERSKRNLPLNLTKNLSLDFTLKLKKSFCTI